MKNFSSDKSKNFKTITLVENNMVIADIFVEHFDTLVPKLGLAVSKNAIIATNVIVDPFLKHCMNIRGILVYLKSKKSIKTWIFLFPV